MKSQIALSITQMKDLEALGVDTTDASMLWINTKLGSEERSLLVSNDVLSACRKLNPVPAYTLEDVLLKLSLYTLNCIGEKFNGQITHDGHVTISVSSNTPLNTAYKLLLWMANNHPDKVKTLSKSNFLNLKQR